MNQQNQASGYPSSVPMKRKRGRPRKEESAVQGETMSAMPPSENVLNSSQVCAGITANDHSDAMVGKVVTGVIEGSFSAGYLLNVKVADSDSDSQLRGLVFLPGQVAPITAQNDVAPQVRMIQRKEIPIPIPVLNPQTLTNDYVPLPPQTLTDDYIPSPAQCSKQPSEEEAELHLPNPQVLPIEMHSSNSLSLENHSASAMAVAVQLPKNEISVPGGGNPQVISEPGYQNQSSSMVSNFECENPVRNNETFHQIDVSTDIKESGTDGGATKDQDPKPASEPIIFLPTIETTQTGQQTNMLSEQKPSEPIRDEINKTSEIELNKSPAESMPSEQVTEPVQSFMEKQASPKTEGLQDMVGKLATTEMLSLIDTSNSNGKSNTGVGNGIDMVGLGSNLAPDSSQPKSMVSEEIKISSEGCAFQDKSGGSFDAIGKVDVNQPTET